MTNVIPTYDLEAVSASVLECLRDTLLTQEGFVPLHVPALAGAEWDYVKECLDTGWVSTAGKFVERFEL